ncbi:hypothetical protein [Pleionea sediminis]|uniref:hypothetical protein n=1 Tax=Pleionea sediminis TaxID=2569479 RepID=UPI0011871A9D|nr:hypothetical protein [Pleionea sediminis]
MKQKWHLNIQDKFDQVIGAYKQLHALVSHSQREEASDSKFDYITPLLERELEDVASDAISALKMSEELIDSLQEEKNKLKASNDIVSISKTA